MDEKIRDLINAMNEAPVFQDIENERIKVDAMILAAVDSLNGRDLFNAIARACKVYQVNGYFRGINQGIQMANMLNKKQVHAIDTVNGRQVV